MNSKVKVAGHSSPSGTGSALWKQKKRRYAAYHHRKDCVQEEIVAKVVGATSSEDFLVETDFKRL